MLAALRSIWIWTSILLLILVWLPVMALTRLFDRDPARYATGRMFRRLGAAMTRANPAWRVRVEGEMPADPRRPYVVVCNHQSNADIPVVSRLPWEMKWVGKAELFRLPFVGWYMAWSDDIPVDRADPRSRATVLTTVRETLARRCSVIFFPEGTRSPDGLVHAFNDGAFAIAIKTKAPILPLAIDGTTEALPKGGWVFGPPADIRLAVLPPVPTDGLTSRDAPALRKQVRCQIAAQIAAWRGTTPEAVLAPEPAALDAPPEAPLPSPDASVPLPTRAAS